MGKMNRIDLLNTMIETRHWKSDEEYESFLNAHETYEECYDLQSELNDEEMVLLIRSCSEKEGMMEFVYLLEDAILLYLDDAPNSRELFIVESLKNTEGYFELLLILSGLLQFHPETCEIMLKELKKLPESDLQKIRAVLEEEKYDFPDSVLEYLNN